MFWRSKWLTGENILVDLHVEFAKKFLNLNFKSRPCQGSGKPEKGRLSLL